MRTFTRFLGGRAPVVVLAVALVGDAEAAVLCQKRSGAVFVREACKKKEKVLDLTQFGAVGPTGPGGPAGSPDGPDDVRRKFFAGTACPGTDPQDVMIRVGNTCVDVYEASVWTASAGGTQIEFPGAACTVYGDDCSDLYARSVAGVIPARQITWFQAQQMCRNAGKRLLTNAEWQMAAAGTPDPGVGGDGVSTCNTSSPGLMNTGSGADCVSRAGVRDMVGNVWEWVADWAPAATACPGLFGGDDLVCFAGASTTDSPAALIRGGSNGTGTGAGVFALGGSTQPDQPQPNVGFRCGR